MKHTNLRHAVAAGTLLLTVWEPASAQVVIYIDRANPFANCVKENWVPRSKDIEANALLAERGIQAYLKLASAGGDISKSFVGSKRKQHWALDGNPVPTPTARDPWARNVARVERTALITGGNRIQYRALWTAYAGDGTKLGTYDAWLQGYWLLGMDLYSSSGRAKPKPLTRFCIEPGDVDEWNAKEAQRQADRAAKANSR